MVSDKLDMAWAHLLSQAPIMADPGEYRAKITAAIFGDDEGAEVVEFEEVRGLDGQMIRVPKFVRVDPETGMASLDGTEADYQKGRAAQDAALLAAFKAEIERPRPASN